MDQAGRELARGLDALRAAVAAVLLGERTALAGAAGWLLSEAPVDAPVDGVLGGPSGPGPSYDDADRAASSEESEADRTRLIALVELARGGDSEAFGLLYDHYQPSVYRFLY